MKEKKVWCNDYTLTPVVKWCLDEFLKMDTYSLSVNCCVFLQWGKAGHFSPPDQVQLAQDLEGIERFHALFHELRHYYQFKTGMWDFNPAPYLRDPKPEWDEQKRKLERYWDYRHFPWELDACENSMEALTKFWKPSRSFGSTTFQSLSVPPRNLLCSLGF